MSTAQTPSRIGARHPHSATAIPCHGNAPQLVEAVKRDVMPRIPDGRGYRKLFLTTVTQADQGCNFDFLRGADCGASVPRRRAAAALSCAFIAFSLKDTCP